MTNKYYLYKVRVVKLISEIQTIERRWIKKKKKWTKKNWKNIIKKKKRRELHSIIFSIAKKIITRIIGFIYNYLTIIIML